MGNNEFCQGKRGKFNCMRLAVKIVFCFKKVLILNYFSCDLSHFRKNTSFATHAVRGKIEDGQEAACCKVLIGKAKVKKQKITEVVLI